MIVFLLGFRTSQIGMEALGLGFEVSCLGFEDWGLGFVILRRNLEAQTPRVGICLGFAIWGRNLEAQTVCVWGSRFCPKTSKPSATQPPDPPRFWLEQDWNL